MLPLIHQIVATCQNIDKIVGVFYRPYDVTVTMPSKNTPTSSTSS
jgi:hypothetical protein